MLAVPILCAEADNPLDVLFDALALLFLFNLDDIGGDLELFGDDAWPGARLQWAAKYLAKLKDEESHQYCESFTSYLQQGFAYLEDDGADGPSSEKDDDEK